MKLKRVASFGASLLISLSSLFVIAPTAHAAARVWDGEGSDDNFSTAANWAGDVAPGNGDSISIGYDVLFAGCTADVVLVNDLDPGTVTLAGITMTGSKPGGCNHGVVINGSSINTSGDIDGGTSRLEIDVTTITASAPITIKDTTITNGLAIGSNNVTLDSAYVYGSISGSGQLTMQENGGGGGACGPYATPTDNNSGFSGTIVLGASGYWNVNESANNLIRKASSVSVSATGGLGYSLPPNADMTLSSTALTYNGGSHYVSQNEADCDQTPSAIKTMTISGPVTFTADTTFLLYYVNLVFSGSVTGAEHVKINNSSRGNITVGSTVLEAQKFQTDYAANSPSTNVDASNNETAVVTGTYGNAYVHNGGTLKGTGTVGDLSVENGGTLAPGMSPGCLSSSNLTFVTGATYDFEVGGTTPCTDYDQMKVTGTVTLGNGTLNMIRYNDFKPVKDQQYTIIDNDGSDAVTGTFLNLAEGATFTKDGYVLKISYVGGDSNDVVLTVQSVPASPDTGFKFLTSSPIVTFIVIVSLAGGMLALAQRYSKHFSY